jgi:hypothetical protein
MRLVMVIAALFALCGCQTKVTTQANAERSADFVTADRVFAAYRRHFPEAQRVALATNALSYFSGVYRDGLPGGLALRGRNLYLFPDGKFILTEWADIMPETVLMAGGWSYKGEHVCLTGLKPTDVVEDLTFVPLRFTDAKRDVIVLLGTPGGYRSWAAWVTRFEPELRKARERYNDDVRVRTDFRFSTPDEEMLYVTFFHGTYARAGGFGTAGWEAARADLLSRTQPPRE